MILDKENIFSDDQAITASAESTNLVDLGAVDSKVQIHNTKGKVRLVVLCTETFTNLTSLDIALRTSSTKTGTTANSSLSGTVVSKLTKNITLANLVAGNVLIDQELPVGMKQYADNYFTVNGSAPDAGKIHSSLVIDSQIANMVGV